MKKFFNWAWKMQAFIGGFVILTWGVRVILGTDAYLLELPAAMLLVLIVQIIWYVIDKPLHERQKK